jgi:sugar/nucleoside kinase (ribokinase family)
MPTEPPPLDLLIVGGLTIDRFPDGSSAPGGTIIHATRNAFAAGLRIGVVTVSGDEPMAKAAVDELRAKTAWLSCAPSPQTTTFRHHGDEERRLSLELRSGALALPRGGDLPPTAAVLAAPIAGELPPDLLAMSAPAARRGAILQGWLRTVDLTEVRPLPLAAIPASATAALSEFDVLIASRQDLVAESEDAGVQLARLRATFGPAPSLVITDGQRGAWLQDGLGRGGAAPPGPGAPVHLAPPRIVRGRSAVGAGDIVAARLLADSESTTTRLPAAVERAMGAVAEELESRPTID